MQKTAYEVRISDWSSDVCSSDLSASSSARRHSAMPTCRRPWSRPTTKPNSSERKSVVEGKSVSVRVDLVGRRIIKSTNNNYDHCNQVTLSNLSLHTVNHTPTQSATLVDTHFKFVGNFVCS